MEKARRTALKDGADCVLCLRFGVRMLAEVADHLIPAADGDFEGALQALRGPCHVLKRRIEGRWRKSRVEYRRAQPCDWAGSPAPAGPRLRRWR